MSDADARQIERLKQLFDSQKTAFGNERHRPLAKRAEDLDRLIDLCQRYSDKIVAAISEDFGVRAREETLIGEVVFVKTDAAHMKKHLRKWAKPRRVGLPLTMMPGKAEIRREPKGVAGIIAPWNYPFQLAFAPLAAALAAGCRAIIKPSELTPATSELMKTMIADAFNEDHVSVVTGGPAVGEAFTKLRWDHLFFTGSPAIGRLVALAAAENLVPTTLELGGKSPAIVLDDYPVEAAARSIAWGKLFNAGQTCVAPDYVMTANGRERQIGEAIIAAAQKQFPDASSDEAYTSIVSDRHFDRLSAMLDEASEGGAEILQPEHDAQAAQAARKIPPTVVLNAAPDSRVMTEEIFGPILPVIGYPELDSATRYVTEREHPLALYVYTKDKERAQRVLDNTLSGGATVNQALLHLSVPDLPFGGIGQAGQGAYHGEQGFLAFSHERSVFSVPSWHPSKLLAPPYGKMAENLIKRQMK